MSQKYKIHFRESDNSHTVRFRTGGAMYARVLSFLLPHISIQRPGKKDSKTRSKLELPDHIQWFLEHDDPAYRSGRQRVIQDFGTILLHARADDYVAKVTLPQQQTEEDARHLAQQTVTLFNAGFGSNMTSLDFRIEGRENHNSGYEGQTIYTPHVRVNAELRERLLLMEVVQKQGKRWSLTQ